MSIKDLKQHLATLSEKQLQNEILNLYRNHKNIKEFYDSQLNADDQDKILSAYKKLIKEEFFPKYGYGEAHRPTLRKIINDYKKIAQVNENLVELAFYYVEQGVNFTLAYGDIDEAFYNNIERMFDQALKWSNITGTRSIFQNRAEMICKNTSEIGWGFHDTLVEIYKEHFTD